MEIVAFIMLGSIVLYMFQQVQDRVWKSDDIIEYFPLLEQAAKQVLRLRQLMC